jgi:hypothetical protein
MKAITEIENLEMPDKLVTAFVNLANLFGDMGESEKQKEYVFKAIAAAKKKWFKNIPVYGLFYGCAFL